MLVNYLDNIIVFYIAVVLSRDATELQLCKSDSTCDTDIEEFTSQKRHPLRSGVSFLTRDFLCSVPSKGSCIFDVNKGAIQILHYTRGVGFF